jgi:hypothetical protein
MATEREHKLFHNCKVVEKTEDEYNGREVWKVTVDKEVFGGQYATVLTRVEPEVANRLERGKQYNLIMERQNKKKPDHNGEKDWMWYWGIVGIADADAQQAERPTSGAAPRQTTTSSESWGNLDERIAWNSAINNAVHAIPYAEMKLSIWLKDVDGVAHALYPLIRRGPLPPDMAEDTPPEPPVEPTAEDVQYLADALDAQESSAERRIIEI